MCRVYKIDFHSFSTVYSGQSQIVHDVCNSQKTFCVNVFYVYNSIVKLLADRRF